MSIDVSKYRNKNETEKEWFLKKLFIEKYHDQYDEARLLCLAQCYANVETLGCTYAPRLMSEIKELTKDFKPKIQELFDQEDKLKQMDKKFNDIKFVASKAPQDAHYKQQTDQLKQLLQLKPTPTVSVSVSSVSSISVETPPPPVKKSRNVSYTSEWQESTQRAADEARAKFAGEKRCSSAG